MDNFSDIIAPNACIVTHIGKKHMATLGDISTAASEMLKICQQPHTDEWVIVPK